MMLEHENPNDILAPWFDRAGILEGCIAPRLALASSCSVPNLTSFPFGHDFASGDVSLRDDVIYVR